MTRRSKRELERAVEDLDGDTEGDTEDRNGPPIVYDMGDRYVGINGEPVPTDADGEPVGPAWGTTIIFDGEHAEHVPPGADP
jgi:hypothetical protein